MKKLSPCLQNPELIGMACGWSILSFWPLLETLLMKPGWALLVVILLASAAGFLGAGRATHLSFETERCVRRGVWAGFFAVMAASTGLILMARMISHVQGPLRATLIAFTSAMPALLAGTLAAGGGVLLFRRPPGKPPGATTTPADLPKSTRLLIRGVTIFALAGAILSPLIPERAVVRSDPPPRLPAAPAERVKPAPKPDVPVNYLVPKELETLPVVGWTIAYQRDLGRIRSDRGLALSKSGQYLAGLDPAGGIVIHALESDRVQHLPAPSHPISHLTFSPDQQRLFVVMEDNPRRVAVVNLATGEFIALPQPKKHAVPDTRVSWWKDQGVVFLSTANDNWELDLETLEFNRVVLSTMEVKLISTTLATNLPSNERWAFKSESTLLSTELPEVGGTLFWRWQSSERLTLMDQVFATSVTFPEIETGNCEGLFGVENGSKILMIRNGVLTVYYMGPSSVQPLRWSLTMPHGPESMKENDLVRKAVTDGSLSLILYAPLINPLNQKTIGPDRDKPKAVLRFLRWFGQEAEVWIETSMAAVTEGNVLADIFMPGSPPLLFNFNKDHRFWMLAPSPMPDGANVKNLPARSSLSKPGNPTGNDNGKSSSATNPATIEPANIPVRAHDDLKNLVSAFLFTHHSAASNGRLKELVDDYADRVDYFDKGMVGRDFILKDETEYHQKYKFVRETMKGPLTLNELGSGKVEVSYLMANEWQRLADNLAGGGVFRISLILEERPVGWKIIRQRSDKQN